MYYNCLNWKRRGLISEYYKTNIIVPSSLTARIQKIHILIGHIFCEVIDNQYK
jgi:D-sedoheptulose 7-phosphate isomerase